MAILALLFVLPFLDIIQFILNPFKIFIKGIKIRIEKELSFIQKLENYDVTELSYVADRIEMEYQQISECVQVIVGDISKIGFLPVLVGLAVTIFSIYQTSHKFTFVPSSFLEIIPFICIGFIGVSIASLIHAYNTRRAKVFIFLIRRVIASKKSKNTENYDLLFSCDA